MYVYTPFTARVSESGIFKSIFWIISAFSVYWLIGNVKEILIIFVDKDKLILKRKLLTFSDMELNGTVNNIFLS